ncbi:hypothetical protein D3C71_1660000 [compost metagenome]
MRESVVDLLAVDTHREQAVRHPTAQDGQLAGLLRSVSGGKYRRLHTRGEVEFSQDVLHVYLHRGLGDVELTGDVFVAVAARDKVQDFEFSHRQRGELSIRVIHGCNDRSARTVRGRLRAQG